MRDKIGIGVIGGGGISAEGHLALYGTQGAIGGGRFYLAPP